MPLAVYAGSERNASNKCVAGLARFGTHHSKGMLLFYRTGLRVVIATANYLRGGTARLASGFDSRAMS